MIAFIYGRREAGRASREQSSTARRVLSAFSAPWATTWPPLRCRRQRGGSGGPFATRNGSQRQCTAVPRVRRKDEVEDAVGRGPSQLAPEAGMAAAPEKGWQGCTARGVVRGGTVCLRAVAELGRPVVDLLVQAARRSLLRRRDVRPAVHQGGACCSAVHVLRCAPRAECDGANIHRDWSDALRVPPVALCEPASHRPAYHRHVPWLGAWQRVQCGLPHPDRHAARAGHHW